ncbi:hypothetical protein [Paenimyroides tangerinum]|uniref:hypothetical protein n=1 Tax=Paenimyroides tangerinum TaxID=2488728 RepID=UPI00193971D9|nr:hypothetical protein [Paenimyroides tangerinum]
MITPKEKIQTELEEIQNFLELTQSEDINEAVYRGNELAVYMARSGKLLADAKIHREEKLNSEVMREIKSLISLPASTSNKFIETLTREENHLVNWADRLNAACSRQLEWCRTIISKGKAEMQALQMYQG